MAKGRKFARIAVVLVAVVCAAFAVGVWAHAAAEARAGAQGESNPNARADALLLPDSSQPTFTIPAADLREPVTVIAYGDMRFTDPREKVATDPKIRMEIVRRVAEKRPDVLLLNGDVVWHGGNTNDYTVYQEETQIWRAEQLRVFPALGNHEFDRCEAAQCLQNWWNAFPELKGRRWYSVRVGMNIETIALDSDDSLEPGSRQVKWLTSQLDALPPEVEFVFITLHHPPVADANPILRRSHDVRPNEAALANYLKVAAQAQNAKIVVIAGHVHNYERFYQDGLMYIVSGGGGATPYPVIRSPSDLYKSKLFPNYSYLEFVLEGKTLRGTMYRLSTAREWEVKDTFEMQYK